MMMGYGYGSSLAWLGMGFGMVIHLAFTVIMILAAIWMFKAVFRNGRKEDKSLSVADILKERYAKGEITSEEYQRMNRELE